MARRITEGECPYCGSGNLEYGVFEPEDCGGYYPCECLDCRQTFHEWYDLEFAGHSLHNGEFKERGDENIMWSIDYCQRLASSIEEAPSK